MSRLRQILLKWAIGLGGAVAALLSGSAAASWPERRPAADPAAFPQPRPITLTSPAPGEANGLDNLVAGSRPAEAGDPPAYGMDFKSALADAGLLDTQAFRASFSADDTGLRAETPLQITPVPEPAGATALAGLVVAGLLQRRRRGRPA